MRQLARGLRWVLVFLLVLARGPVTFLLSTLAFPAAPVLEWVAWMQPADDPWRLPLLICIPVAALLCLALAAVYDNLVRRIVPRD